MQHLLMIYVHTFLQTYDNGTCGSVGRNWSKLLPEQLHFSFVFYLLVTVEPCLANGHSLIADIFYIMTLTVLPFTSILKQFLNSGHPATPYNKHFLCS